MGKLSPVASEAQRRTLDHKIVAPINLSFILKLYRIFVIVKICLIILVTAIGDFKTRLWSDKQQTCFSLQKHTHYTLMTFP